MDIGPLSMQEPASIQRQVNVNTLQPIYTLKVLVAQLTSRSKRTGIVVVSSSAALGPIAGLTTYCATKTFASYLARGLNYELRDTCDVLAWQPAGIKTNIARDFDVDEMMKKDYAFVLSVESAVRQMFCQLGKEKVGPCNWNHALQLSAMGLLPVSLVNSLALKHTTKASIEMRKKKN